MCVVRVGTKVCSRVRMRSCYMHVCFHALVHVCTAVHDRAYIYICTATRTICNRVHKSRAPVTGWHSCAYALYLSAPQAPLVGAPSFRTNQHGPATSRERSPMRTDMQPDQQDGALLGERKHLEGARLTAARHVRNKASPPGARREPSRHPVPLLCGRSPTATPRAAPTPAPLRQSTALGAAIVPTSLSLWEGGEPYR